MKQKVKRGSREIHHFKIVTLIAGFFVIILLAMNQISMPSERIVYVQSEEDGSSNLWMVSLNNPEHPRQLTFNEASRRIYEYQVTSDSLKIVYLNMNYGNSYEAELILLDIRTGYKTVLVSCPEGNYSCDDFELSSTGDFLIYFSELYPDEHEIRLIDLTTQHYDNRLIYHFTGIRPGWWIPHLSIIGESNLITFYISEYATVLKVFDIEQNAFLESLPTVSGVQNLFTEDGSRYVYDASSARHIRSFIEVRKTVPPNNFVSHYQEWDYAFPAKERYYGAIHDWHPDNEHLLISIGYVESCESTSSNSQYIHLQFHTLNTTTDTLEPLPAYGNSGNWNSDGTQIIYSRLINPCGERSDSELVIYDMETASNTTLPIIGIMPRWLG